jgi:hypothetical protein
MTPFTFDPFMFMFCLLPSQAVLAKSIETQHQLPNVSVNVDASLIQIIRQQTSIPEYASFALPMVVTFGFMSYFSQVRVNYYYKVSILS